MKWDLLAIGIQVSMNVTRRVQSADWITKQLADCIDLISIHYNWNCKNALIIHNHYNFFHTCKDFCNIFINTGKGFHYKFLEKSSPLQLKSVIALKFQLAIVKCIFASSFKLLEQNMRMIVPNYWMDLTNGNGRVLSRNFERSTENVKK